MNGVRAVFLDRDGVLNHAVVREGRPYPPGDVSELRIVDGAAPALQHLRDAGYRLIVVTNQPDVARGTTPRPTVDAINAKLAAALPLDEIVVCDEDGDAPCKKPNPGMLLDAAKRHGIDLGRSFMVGDRWRDVGAGEAAGTRTVFIDRGYAETPPLDPDLTVGELEESTAWIIETALAPRS